MHVSLLDTCVEMEFVHLAFSRSSLSLLAGGLKFGLKKRSNSCNIQINDIKVYIFEISIRFCVDWYMTRYTYLFKIL